MTDTTTHVRFIRTALVAVLLLAFAIKPAVAQDFTMDQTLSDEAQRTTIAFDGLAFLSGSLGADSFFPPGKVADFWGFQYLRDNDPSHMGHNTGFLTSASLNMLTVLTHQQRLDLISLANQQVDVINQYGYDRFVLMKAFRRLLEGSVPDGSTGLNREAVKAFSAQLYRLDGRISYERAHIMGSMIASLTTPQRAYLDSMVGKGMLQWPTVPEPPELQGLNHDVKVAVMTYSGDMFSWYAGSVAADVYFCPERQGTYFGSFYMKDAPAVGNPDYTIDPNLTANYGRYFLHTLTPAESTMVSNLVDIQRPYLYEIVDRRAEVSTYLRLFMTGGTPDSLLVMNLMDRYGELDGDIVYSLASTFADVQHMLTDVQKDTLMALRHRVLGDFNPTGAFLYASEIPIPAIQSTDFLFTTSSDPTYPVVGTDVTSCFDNTTTIPCPVSPSDPFYGQFPGENLPAYQNNGNGTVTDLVTGLMWQRSPDANGDNDGIIEKADKLTWPQIQARLAVLNSSNYAGHNDWRIPTIKELYSLTNWNGTDPSGLTGTSTAGLLPFIDSTYFPFAWGQTSAGERLIDVQYASGNLYQDLAFNGNQMLFGVNFADGRIKGYELVMPGGSAKVFSFIAVRGNTGYGINDLVDNGNQTITDNATKLMWTKDDSQTPMNWEAALAFAQTKNAANYCGHSDWRLPTTKELQSIVDYSRSPGSTVSAAISPLFNTTSITNEASRTDWPWYWTSTTHRSYNGSTYGGSWGIYICFGRAGGWVRIGANSYYSYVDVHGAGAQRSSPKSGTYLGDYMGVDSLGQAVYGLGPQGDILRVNNFVRLVRDITSETPFDSGSVHGRMYYDENQNGSLDSAEQGLEGWKVILGGSTSDTVTTTTGGFFTFGYPDSGLYGLRAEARDGWTQTFPAQAETTILAGAGTVRLNIGMYRPSVRFFQFGKGWNLVSVPLAGNDYARGTLFPTAASAAYAYGTEYSEYDTLTPGVGYWLKFASAQSLAIAGSQITGDTLTLQAGWNLIGVIGVPVAVTDIVSDSPGVALGLFYGYDGRYSSTDTLQPSDGYWVKSEIPCSIILGQHSASHTLFTVRLIDTGELPPAPPDPSGVHNGNLPQAFALLQNYPNPFNPATRIVYQLPVDSRVKLGVYNILGQCVAMLEDGIQQAGAHTVEWNASGMASGVYFYRIEAAGDAKLRHSFVRIMKMLLVR